MSPTISIFRIHLMVFVQQMAARSQCVQRRQLGQIYSMRIEVDSRIRSIPWVDTTRAHFAGAQTCIRATFKPMLKMKANPNHCEYFDKHQHTSRTLTRTSCVPSSCDAYGVLGASTLIANEKKYIYIPIMCVLRGSTRSGTMVC